MNESRRKRVLRIMGFCQMIGSVAFAVFLAVEGASTFSVGLILGELGLFLCVCKALAPSRAPELDRHT